MRGVACVMKRRVWLKDDCGGVTCVEDGHISMVVPLITCYY